MNKSKAIEIVRKGRKRFSFSTCVCEQCKAYNEALNYLLALAERVDEKRIEKVVDKELDAISNAKEIATAIFNDLTGGKEE